MNIELKLVGELNELAPVLNVLVGSQTVKGATPVKAAPAAAAKVQAETAEGSEEVKKAPTPAAAPAKKAAAPAAKAQAPKAAPKPVAMSDEDKVAALEAIESAEDQLATVQAEVTKLTKKGRTADVKKLLAIYASPKVSELDPAVYVDFYGLVLRLAGGEAADDIVESFEV